MPEIVPVVALIASPFGSPVALKVSVSLSGSLAASGSETVAFSASVRPASAVRTGAWFTLVTVQVKVVLPVANAGSVAVTVTGCVPALV